MAFRLFLPDLPKFLIGKDTVLILYNTKQSRNVPIAVRLLCETLYIRVQSL